MAKHFGPGGVVARMLLPADLLAGFSRKPAQETMAISVHVHVLHYALVAWTQSAWHIGTSACVHCTSLTISHRPGAVGYG